MLRGTTRANEPRSHRSAGPSAERTRRSKRDLFDGLDDGTLPVFVPAIMSVGLVFSILSMLRNALRWSGARARDRRARFEAEGVVAQVLGRPRPDPRALGLLSRPSYLVAGLALTGGAAYVAIGSTANFLRNGGYVRDIAWLLAISLGLAVALGFIGGISLLVFLSWPHPPAVSLGPLRSAPLTMTPDRRASGPPWALGAATLSAGVCFILVTLAVAKGSGAMASIDRPILDWLVTTDWLDRLGTIDMFGSTVISIVFVAAIGMSGFRCRAMAWIFPTAFVVSWLAGEAVRRLVARPRPLDISDLQSYPSGHLVQAVFIAGLLPIALRVMLNDRRLVVITQALLAVAVAITAVHRIHRQNHWPLDAVGGAALGLVVVLGASWMLEHRRFHRGCASCPWAEHPGHLHWDRPVFSFGQRTVRRLERAGVGLALLGAGALALGTIVVGLPTDPEGYGFASTLLVPAQVTLAILVAVGGLASLWSRPAGAFIGVVAATFLGLLASVQYSPTLATLLTVALVVPAVVTWLAWQAGETLGSISLLAVLTVAAVASTAIGSREIYDHYLGPTHPDSTAIASDSEASWLWLGGVSATGATIVAGDFPVDDAVALTYWTVGSTTRTTVWADVEHGVGRFTLNDLDADTTYGYVVSTDPVAGASQRLEPDASFDTHQREAHDVVIVAGSCARTGSNGAVFDAIAAEDPDLYLAIGDLHYSNLASTDPSAHLDAYRRTLVEPGPAAVFSSVPTAYVWDDHDYGPNDADATAPSRLAVSTAYRRAVPHHGVDPDPDASIAQAFTIGRVRVVLTDTRSQRTSTTMLGEAQLEWLIDELQTASEDHAVVVWANPTPWVATDAPDTWADHPAERQRLLDEVGDLPNLVMVSGDAHMVAIDDGSNTGLGESGSFPLLHAGALDRPGSVKGGPYSHGTFPGGGQYGRIEILDDGGPVVTVRLSGHDWTGAELVAFETEVAVGR